MIGALKILVAILLGAAIGSAGVWYIMTHNDPEIGNSYYVARIVSHYPHTADNSETHLSVYISGRSGHVKKLICLFPPELELQGGPNPDYATQLLEGKKDAVWSGITRVHVTAIGMHYIGGEVGYYCERLE